MYGIFIGATIFPPTFNCSFHASGKSCPEAAEIILSKGVSSGIPFVALRE